MINGRRLQNKSLIFPLKLFTCFNFAYNMFQNEAIVVCFYWKTTLSKSLTFWKPVIHFTCSEYLYLLLSTGTISRRTRNLLWSQIIRHWKNRINPELRAPLFPWSLGIRAICFFIFWVVLWVMASSPSTQKKSNLRRRLNKSR